MYPEALAALRCPACAAAPLHLSRDIRQGVQGEIVQGHVVCSACGRRYPIRDGVLDLLVPRALPFSPAQVVNALPPAAWAYERTWRPRSLSLLTGEPFGYARELPLVVGLLNPAAGGLYVDVACSNGLYARAIAQRLHPAQGHVVGIDHSLPMLHQARSFAQQAGLRISYVRAWAQALPFAAGSVAGVAMGGSLNEIGDTAGSLAEIGRVLRPAGRFVSMNLVRAERTAGRALQTMLGTGGLDFWSPDQLNRLFDAAGLRLAAQWRYGVVVFSLLLPRSPEPPTRQP